MENLKQTTASKFMTGKPVNLEKRIKTCEAKVRSYNQKFYETADIDFHYKVEQEEEKIRNYVLLLQLIAGEAITKDRLIEKRACHIFAEGAWHPIKSYEEKKVIVFFVEGNACTEKSFPYTQIETFKTLEEFCREFDINSKAIKPGLTFTLADCIEVEF